MCPQRPSENESEPGLPPGADRFWGQMSQAKGGRSRTDEELPPEPEPEAAPGGEPGPGEGHGHGHGNGHECLEWCPICRSVELLRGASSPEVRQQLQAIQNEAMQVFKAFATAYAERSAEDPPPRRGAGAEPGEGRRPDPPAAAGEPIDISIE